MSNKIFSPKRFWLYFYQYINVNIKKWLLASLVAMGVMIIFSLLSLNHLKDAKEHFLFFFHKIWSNSILIYSIGLYAIGLILTVTSFNNFSYRQSGIFYISLPATTFEKLLAHWIITVPVFLIFYQLLWIATSVIVNYFAGMISGLNLGLFIPVWKNSFDYGSQNIEILTFYIMVQSFFFAGTVLTGKNSFIITTIAAMLMLLFTILLNQIIDSAFFDNNNNFNLYSYFKLYSPSLHTNLKMIMLPVLWLRIPVFYVLAYYFLKEKEV